MLYRLPVEIIVLNVTALGMPCQLQENQFVTWRMDSVTTALQIQWDISVRNVWMTSSVIQPEGHLV